MQIGSCVTGTSRQSLADGLMLQVTHYRGQVSDDEGHRHGMVEETEEGPRYLYRAAQVNINPAVDCTFPLPM